MSLKQRLPFLRWSVWRMGLGLHRFIKTGQIGDGREEACAAIRRSQRAARRHRRRAGHHRQVRHGEVDPDQRRRREGRAARRRRPPCRPEAGAGARHLLRLQRAAHRPGRAVRQGVLRRVRRGQRRSGPADLGARRCRRPRHLRRRHHRRRRARRSTRWPPSTASAPAQLDLLFIDHDKSAYLPDLQSILDRGWLHPGIHRRRRQRPRSRRAEVPRIHARAAGQAVEHRRAQDARRVPDAGAATWCWSRSISAAESSRAIRLAIRWDCLPT